MPESPPSDRVPSPAPPLPPPGVMTLVEDIFENDALPVLEEYIRIPCLSPDFDPDWAAHGHIKRAAELLRVWSAARPITGLSVELLELPGLTPVIVAEIPASSAPSAASPVTAGPGDRATQKPGNEGGAGDYPLTLLYGHLDKQPPLGAWREGLHPFKPVREGDRLYGRGAADDGYSIFAALGAVQAAADAGLGHGRCLMLIEASEESGSPHLPAYLEALSDRLGSSGPALVVCLDSGCLTYDRFWTTTSLRGLVSAQIRVDVLTEGVHSGFRRRRRAVVVPHPATAAVADRGSDERRDPPVGMQREHPQVSAGRGSGACLFSRSRGTRPLPRRPRPPDRSSR